MDLLESVIAALFLLNCISDIFKEVHNENGTFERSFTLLNSSLQKNIS